MTDYQSEVRRGGLYPARVVCIWAWQRSKSPWSLALIVTDNQSQGRRGGLYPARVMCPWAWKPVSWKKAEIFRCTLGEKRIKVKHS